jgi:hypothetical protein
MLSTIKCRRLQDPLRRERDDGQVENWMMLFLLANGLNG